MRTHRSSYNRPSRIRGKHGLKSHRALVQELLLQPWFLPTKTARAIHSLVPVDFHNKMRYVFEDYGCLICGIETGYHSNGMCQKCHSRTCGKILLSLRRRGRQGGQPRLDLELFRQQKLAKKLLSRFIPEGQNSPREAHHGMLPSNPVYEALAYRVLSGQNR